MHACFLQLATPVELSARRVKNFLQDDKGKILHWQSSWLQCKECASQLILDGNKVVKKTGD
jgi:hypothetical protein